MNILIELDVKHIATFVEVTEARTTSTIKRINVTVNDLIKSQVFLRQGKKV